MAAPDLTSSASRSTAAGDAAEPVRDDELAALFAPLARPSLSHPCRVRRRRQRRADAPCRALGSSAQALARSSSWPPSIMVCAPTRAMKPIGWRSKRAALGLRARDADLERRQAGDRHPGCRAPGALPAARRARPQPRRVGAGGDRHRPHRGRPGGDAADAPGARQRPRWSHRHGGATRRSTRGLRAAASVARRVSGARLRATLPRRSASGSKIPATMPSASSACACARRAQLLAGARAHQRQDRAQRPPSRAGAGGARRRRARSADATARSICTPAPSPASATPRGAPRPRSCVCVSSPGSSRLTADSPSRCAWRRSRHSSIGWRSAIRRRDAGRRHRLPPRRASCACCASSAACRCRLSSAAGRLRRLGRAISGQRRRRGRRRPSMSARSAREPSRSCASNSTCRAIVPARAAATLPAFWRGAELIIVPYFAALPGVSPAWGTARAALFGRIPWLKPKTEARCRLYCDWRRLARNAFASPLSFWGAKAV